MTPQAAGKIAVARLMANTRAKYLTVQHLPDDAAAIILKVTPGSVRSYRRQYPDTRPDGWTQEQSARYPANAAQVATQRAEAAKVANALAEAKRASGGPPKRSHVVRAGMWGLGDPSKMAAQRVSLAWVPDSMVNP